MARNLRFNGLSYQVPGSYDTKPWWLRDRGWKNDGSPIGKFRNRVLGLYIILWKMGLADDEDMEHLRAANVEETFNAYRHRVWANVQAPKR